MHEGTMAQMKNEIRGISGGNAWVRSEKSDKGFDGRKGHEEWW